MQPPYVLIPDDNLSGVIPGIQRPPEICVDYLSHDWKEEDDIWTSWKVMSKQKKEIVNGVRLENASWRTWAKQKYHLKTVNPERLNWMKDSDVTWLYGPLHRAFNSRKHEESLKSKSPTIQDKLGLMHHHASSTCQKSCLKKKSLSEILLSNTSDRRYPSLVPSHSDSALYKKKKSRAGTGIGTITEIEVVVTEDSKTTLSTSISETSPLVTLMRRHQQERNTEHHIRFNDQVEQCIAVDSAEEEDDDNLGKNSHEDESGDNSSDDGAILMKNSRKKKGKKECFTIHKLDPIPLKSDQMINDYTNNYNDGLFDMGVFTTDMFDHFDPSGSLYGSSPNSTSPSSLPRSKSDSSPRSEKIRGNGNEQDEENDGFVDKAFHIATGVRDIVHWCSNMVFNGQVF
ncbi:14650_t:CDS:2 [Ambispora leptoticha]|uniref:14650_t:CDS:1 n=1 Tax=Ambispora leptoticha TaxID=144679 RepID=A0A9N9AW31_9GLOM|nr:14650_t:CDS:2 [Ambispora leptoticha]